MRDLALDATTGDLALARGTDGFRRATLVQGAAAVPQKLRLRLSLVQGEYVLDAGVGIPYFGQVFAKAAGRRVAEALFRRAITTAPGVRSLESFRLVVTAQRRASLTFSVRAVGSDTPITVTDFVAGSALGGAA